VVRAVPGDAVLKGCFESECVGGVDDCAFSRVLRRGVAGELNRTRRGRLFVQRAHRGRFESGSVRRLNGRAHFHAARVVPVATATRRKIAFANR
jgi:hypothetical protein